MKVKLIARPQLVGIPMELGVARDDQLLGPEAQQLIEVAGRICYDSLGKGRNSSDYAKHILETGHGSVLEHAQFSFYIGGVSRGLTHELVRHRVGVAISQRSTRYVDESDSPWIMHPVEVAFIEDQGPATVTESENLKNLAQSLYADLVGKIESWLVKKGVDKLTARKQARGAARGYLGNALNTELIWSANVRALRHIIGLRGEAAADAEIRELAVRLLRIMQTELPAYFGDFEIMPGPLGEEVARVAV